MRSTITRSNGFRIALGSVLLTAAFSAAMAQRVPAGLDPDSGARLPYLTRADLGEAGKPVADIFARSGEPDEPVSGPLAFAAYNPAVATALLNLHDGAVTQGSLDAHARELAILVACRETNYTLEWNAHVGAARNAGVSDAVIDVVLTGGQLTDIPEADAAVIRFGRELLRDRKMQQSTFATSVELFDERGAMDLVAVISTYAVSGLYAIAVDEHPPGQALIAPLR